MWFVFQSRESRKRDKAQAGLLREQALQLKSERLAGAPLLLQPTLRDLIREALRRRRSRYSG
jgi:hypothetical protein